MNICTLAKNLIFNNQNSYLTKYPPEFNYIQGKVCQRKTACKLVLESYEIGTRRN